MPLARWKDLCIDAEDASVLARFWGAALGRDVELLEPSTPGSPGAVFRGDRPQQTVWINAVPEPKTVKHRVHLDVSVASLDPLLDLGARVLVPTGDSGGHWTVMADPEGGEFCAFVRSIASRARGNDGAPTDPPARWFELMVDTADSAGSKTLADWWAQVLGGRSVDDGRGFWWVEDVPDLPFDTLDVVPVHEPKTVKNRVHWDVTCDDVGALLARGARVLTEPDNDRLWHVLADPQGNEFCAFPSRRPSVRSCG